MVESQPSKLLVAGSSPVSRSVLLLLYKTRVADVAQLVEHFLGKEEVTGSIPVISSGLKQFKTAALQCRMDFRNLEIYFYTSVAQLVE